jgi:hypothetical protein
LWNIEERVDQKEEEEEKDCHANSLVHEKEDCNDDDHPQFSCSHATKKRRRKSSSSFCVFVVVCVSLLSRRGKKSRKEKDIHSSGKRR